MDFEKLLPLICKAQGDDPQAANELFEAIYNDIYYFALKTVKDAEIAADVTQEALIAIFKDIKKLEDPKAFPAWSRKITFHQCTRHFRKNTEITFGEDEEGGSIFDTIEEEKAEFIPDAALDQQDFRQTILAMIDTLSEEQRSAVVLYYFEELSVGEIAEIQGVSEGTVKSRLNYARKSIKASVEAYEEKNGIKLHGLVLMPFLRWTLAGEKAGVAASASAAKAAAAAAVGAGAATATGAVASVSSIGAGAGLMVKLAALPAIAKVIAGVSALALLGGGAVLAINPPQAKEELSPNKEVAATQPQSEQNATVVGDVAEEIPGALSKDEPEILIPIVPISKDEAHCRGIYYRWRKEIIVLNGEERTVSRWHPYALMLDGGDMAPLGLVTTLDGTPYPRELKKRIPDAGSECVYDGIRYMLSHVEGDTYVWIPEEKPYD